MVTTSVPRQWTYNAFVSFRGEDIRKSFIDHLFKDFRQKGIHAFRDDNQLPRGEEISSQLYKAIEESRFLIVIFSKNYASSSWCLRELVKIIECKQMGERKHEVRMIFYDVKPNVVRKQTGSYAEAFAKHEFLNKTEVAKWKEALYVATNLSGWDLQDMANGYESKLIDSISKEILEMLCDGPLHVGEKLVGVDARVNKMNLLRFVGSSKVHMIGICGVGGIGKTTLAKAIYNLIHVHFEECSFLDDVQGATKRHGLLHVVVQLINDIMKTTDVKISNIGQGLMLMKQRMASRSILLVIDGIDHHEQLEALAGSCNWFFPGSLIIFTSKDKRLLSHKVDEIYDMEFLDDDEALELFSLYAFRQKHPTEDFKELTYQVVKYVQGHPLALKVLACFLYGQAVHVWTSELDKLQTYPNADIQQVIRLSFDGLDSIQQRVFLDIASYLIGEMKDFAVSVLDSCNFFADTNIGVLVDRSLVTISRDNALQMHNLIQGMAREIVREESKWVGHRSRLWIQSEVFDVLSRNKGLNDLREDLDMFFHGNRVPRWCTHQSMGSSVMVELPPGWCYNKFRGYEACVVFTLKKSYIAEDESELDTPRCFVHNFDGGLLQWKQYCQISYRFAVASTRIVGSDLIWFHISKRNPYWMKASNFITFSFTSVFLEVKQCGVRLICDEDIQDGGVFYGTHEWVLPTIEENPPKLRIL